MKDVPTNRQTYTDGRAKNTDEMGKKVLKLDLAQCAVFEKLTSERAGRLIKAIVKYKREGREVDDTDIAELFVLFKSQMDEEARLYEEMCRRNKSIANTRVTSRHESSRVVKCKETETETEKRTKKEKDKEKEDLKKDSQKENETTEAAKRNTSVKRFQKPTVEQIEEYVRKLGYKNVDALYFWNYYESKGWVVGKAPMKNWKCAVVNWERMHEQRAEERQQRPKGNSMADRYRQLTHFKHEDNPEAWADVERRFNSEHNK